jgi:dual specificity MAP kinase phosphatase
MLRPCAVVLQDYSKNSYDMKWSDQCWWDRPVVVYGEAGLKKDHPVVAYLARDNHAKSLAVLKEG